MRNKLVGVLTAVLAAGLGMAGCAQSSTSVKPTAQPKPTQTISQPELDEYYQQKLQWRSCGGNFECTTLEVPLDYAEPLSAHAQIALKRLPAYPENNLGTLVMNPGGPGGSGLENMTEQNVNYFFTRPVQQNYDILSFDPRGVGQSKPAINCRTASELDRDNSEFFDLDTARGRAQLEISNRKLAAACQKNAPEIMKFASTDNTARDLDILRAALGEERLNYLGYSYGTYLGAVYADLFPSRVGRFILDGVLDPNSNLNQTSRLQALGFENSLRQFSLECQKYHADECPLHGGGDAGLAQIRNLLDSLIDSPLPTKDPQRVLTASLAFTGIIGSLYNVTSWWQTLMPALDSAINSADGTDLLYSADFYNSRNEDGSYDDNSADAFIVINSLDYVAVGDLDDWEKQAAELQRECPTVGRFFSYASLGTEHWPVPGDPKAKRRINPDLDSDILLISTTGDPATPLEMGESLHSVMDHSRLLVVQGWNHTAYNSAAPECVRETADNYLITGKIPQEMKRSVCEIR